MSPVFRVALVNEVLLGVDLRPIGGSIGVYELVRCRLGLEDELSGTLGLGRDVWPRDISGRGGHQRRFRRWILGELRGP